MSETATVLRKAAELIKKPGTWTQRAFARCDGQNIPITHPKAHCWCVLGAIDLMSLRFNHGDTYMATAALRGHLGLESRADLAMWNDEPSRTQAEVVQALRNAADQAEGKSK